MKKKCGLLISILFILLFSWSVSADQTGSIRRVYPYMPDVTMEVSGIDGMDTAATKVTLGGEKLTVGDVHTYDAAKDSTRVYVLVDVSTSMSGRLDALKEQLNTYIDRLGEKDSIVVMTFGENLTTVLNGSEDRETARSVISGLQADEGGTVLFKALDSAFKASVSVQSKYEREYILLVTDGIDFQKGSETYSEIEEQFKGHLLPIYTLCTENATQEAADNLGELSRMSGGALQMVNAGEEAAAFETMWKEISDVCILKCSAASNRVSGQEELLQIQAGEKVLEQKVEVSRYMADETAPAINRIKVSNSNKKIAVYFSERVENTETKSAVRLLDQDENDLPLSHMEYDKEKNVLYLYPQEQLSGGEYTIVTQGITDASQENNPLAETKKSFSVKKAGKQEEQKDSGFPLWLILLLGAAVILVVVIVVIVILSGRKKKPEQKAERPEELKVKKSVNEVEGRRVVEEEVYKIRQAEGEKLPVYMKLPDGSERKMTLNIVSSLIFGRGSHCDVVIEDKMMSRQHFAIEIENGKRMILDLDSNNGTKVNGIPLKGRKILRAKDKIFAGQTEIVIME